MRASVSSTASQDSSPSNRKSTRRHVRERALRRRGAGGGRTARAESPSKTPSAGLSSAGGMSSSLSEATSRRPASARKGVERWTADIEQRLSDETPRGGYDLHEKRFARVPWREIPTRTRALEAHEFVNPTAYVVRASDAFVYPGHFLEKQAVLEADRAVREAKKEQREEATRAHAERLRVDARLRRETVRAQSARRSRREESIVEDIVRPHARDANTGTLIERSGEYRRLGARDRRLTAPPAGGKKAPRAPVAVTFEIVKEEIMNNAPPVSSSDASTRRTKNDHRTEKMPSFTTSFSKAHPEYDVAQKTRAAATEAERRNGGMRNYGETLRRPASAQVYMRPRKVTPGERVALVHGPYATAKCVPSKKTRGARGALAAKTQTFGYSFDAPYASTNDGFDADADADDFIPTNDDDGYCHDDVSPTRDHGTTRPRSARPRSAHGKAATGTGNGTGTRPPAPAFAARTATLEERLRWAAARRPASARAASFLPTHSAGGAARPERDLASRAAIGAGRVPPRALRNPTNAIAVSYPLHEVPDRRPASAAAAKQKQNQNQNGVDADRGLTPPMSLATPNNALNTDTNTNDRARPPAKNKSAEISAHMASSLAELELGSRGAAGFPAAFVFGARLGAKHALEASESVVKFGEFARGFEKHEGAWASGGRIEPRRPTWR